MHPNPFTQHTNAIMEVSAGVYVYVRARMLQGTHICRLLVVVELLQIAREAEVSDFEDVFLRHQDVPGRQVSVDALHST